MPTGRALEAGRAVIKLTLSTQGFRRQMAKLHKSVGTISRSFTRLGTLNFGGAGGGGLTGGFASLHNLFLGATATTALLWPVKLAANLEEAQAEFTALTGSAATAKQIVDEMQSFQRTAIVPVEQLQQAAAQLLGYGVAGGQVIPILKALTEISRGSGERLSRLALAYGQVRAKQRLYAQEVRQFTESGWNPLDAIIKQTGESMKEVQARMEAGAVSADEVQNALQAAVAPGGRFFNLLNTMADTLIGQFRRLKTEIVLTFRPLGQEVLPAITRFFKALNGSADAVREFIGEHKKLFKALFASSIAGLASLAMFVTMGLTFTVLSVAAGGFGQAIGLLAAALGLLANPVAWLIGALAALGKWFISSTRAGMAFAKHLAGAFEYVGRIASLTFEGISDALMAGDIQAASEVLWAGLRLSWQAGTHDLEQMWIDLKNALASLFVSMGYSLESALTRLVAKSKMLLSDLRTWVQDAWDVIVTLGASAAADNEDVRREVLKAHLDRVYGREVGNRQNQAAIAAQRDAELARLDEERQQIQSRLDEDRLRQQNAAQQELQEAQEKFNEARKKARQARRKAERERPRAPGAPDPLALPDLAAGSAATAPLSLLGNKQFARQILGGGQDEQVKLLAKIEKNTRPREGGLGVA